MFSCCIYWSNISSSCLQMGNKGHIDTIVKPITHLSLRLEIKNNKTKFNSNFYYF